MNDHEKEWQNPLIIEQIFDLIEGNSCLREASSEELLLFGNINCDYDSSIY